MKDIDPEERMNVVKAFVNAFNTYRDGTTVPTVPMVELYRYRGTSNSTSKYLRYLGAELRDAPAVTGHNSLVYTLREVRPS